MGPDDAILFSFWDDEPPPPRRPGERLRWYRDHMGRERWERIEEDVPDEDEDQCSTTM